ncbi:DUF6090 family protein [Lutimonas zeaxanthinifaciens]|uniref:DUF6090 family protein n=1 Tax=Lutimonas zeaxanthinifaciens TaxID=3060215 RepID=UPI00265D107E|nr:DUF6090 family protein [Lutimonas sp. YSD2104]WKK66489.1 DUF6090 family protein [Lutimonas sp. YSD2104]
MLPFFRKIRWRLAQDNQFFKYSRYAIGEIVLVVIGILIALQINTWNEERLKRKKEFFYLGEIRKNLVQDTTSINKVLAFNNSKKNAINETFKLFETSTKENFNLADFAGRMNPLSQFKIFIPQRIAFNNLLDVEKIDLISDLELRTKLSEYYNEDYEKGTQEVTIQRTRAFTEYAGRQLTTQEIVKLNTDATVQIKSNAMSEIYKDELMIYHLLNMSITINYHNGELKYLKQQVKSLLSLLESEINQSNYKN